MVIKGTVTKGVATKGMVTKGMVTNTPGTCVPIRKTSRTWGAWCPPSATGISSCPEYLHRRFGFLNNMVFK